MIRSRAGLSYVEGLCAAAFAGMAVVGIATLRFDAPPDPKAGPDYREALRVAQSEVDALARLDPAEVARQVPESEKVAVIGGSLLETRDRFGALLILGQRVEWGQSCRGLVTSPGEACPGLYRRIERIDDSTPGPTYRVTIIVAWPGPTSEKTLGLRRVDLQTHVG